MPCFRMVNITLSRPILLSSSESQASHCWSTFINPCICTFVGPCNVSLLKTSTQRCKIQRTLGKSSRGRGVLPPKLVMLGSALQSHIVCTLSHCNPWKAKKNSGKGLNCLHPQKQSPNCQQLAHFP